MKNVRRNKCWQFCNCFKIKQHHVRDHPNVGFFVGWLFKCIKNASKGQKNLGLCSVPQRILTVNTCCDMCCGFLRPSKGRNEIAISTAPRPPFRCLSIHFYSINLQFLVMFTLNDIFHLVSRVKDVLCCDH